MNNSSVVPLIKTDMEIGDTHYKWGQMVPQAILIPGKLHCYMYESCYYIFLFERVLIIHMA